MTFYREIGGNDSIVIVGPGLTPGMVQVGKVDEDWQTHPQLLWQTWPDMLEVYAETLQAA